MGDIKATVYSKHNRVDRPMASDCGGIYKYTSGSTKRVEWTLGPTANQEATYN